MTTELEKEFFKTFEIEPDIDYDYKTIIQDVTKTGYWFDKEYLIKMFNDNQKFKVIQVRKNINYPKITAEKLLQLLCIVIDEYNREGHTFYLDSTNIKELKEEILDALMGCIDATCDLFETEVKQIQQLFKGKNKRI